MPDNEYVVVGVGVFFCLLALLGIWWGRREERHYFDTISTRTVDLREFFDRWPSRPQPGAVKVGGWLALMLGVAIIITGIVLLLLP